MTEAATHTLKRARASYRRPLLPFPNAPLGTCVLCNLPITVADKVRPERASWHRACLRLWFVISDPKMLRAFVFRRDKGVCQACGAACEDRPWEADHIKPLCEAHGDLAYWMPDNAQLLCIDCHRKKTATENSQRKGPSHDPAPEASREAPRPPRGGE